MNKGYLAAMVAIIAIVTALLRFLPFWIFKDRETPEYIKYLGRVLPYSIMGMLVVYCLKGVSFLSLPFGIPEVVACAIVVLIHILRRNTLLSIFSGTVSYMIMVQFIF